MSSVHQDLVRGGPCQECQEVVFHKPGCLAGAVQRGELTPREAQIMRLESQVPCPRCRRKSRLGEHDCDAVKICSDDGDTPGQHLYEAGYDACVECGEPQPEVNLSDLTISGQFRTHDVQKAMYDQIIGLAPQKLEAISASMSRVAKSGIEATAAMDRFAKAADHGQKAHHVIADEAVGQYYGVPIHECPALDPNEMVITGDRHAFLRRGDFSLTVDGKELAGEIKDFEMKAEPAEHLFAGKDLIDELRREFRESERSSLMFPGTSNHAGLTNLP